MLPILLAIFLFLLLMTVISVYGYRAYVRPSRIYDRVGGVAESAADSETVSVKPRDVVVRVFEQIGEQIPLTPGDQTATKRDLVMAGYRSEGAIRIYFGIKVMFCLVMFVFALMLHRHITDNPVLRIVFVIAATGLGYYAPGYYLESLVKKRQTKLRLSLPDALDMMVVSVEAGLGLDQALQYVAREIEETHPELSDEMALVGLEMRAGKQARGSAAQPGGTDRRRRVAQAGGDSGADRPVRHQHGRKSANAFGFHADAAQTGGGRAGGQGRGEAGVSDLSVYSAFDDDCRGRTRAVEAFRGFVPPDAELWQVTLITDRAQRNFVLCAERSWKRNESNYHTVRFLDRLPRGVGPLHATAAQTQNKLLIQTAGTRGFSRVCFAPVRRG